MLAGMTTLRTLSPRDEEALERYLVRHPDTTMFLRANLARAGLVDRGERHHATYAAAFEGDAVVAACAHCWNGMLIVEAASHAEPLARLAVRSSGRALSGLVGPSGQVMPLRRALGLAERAASLEEPEILFALDLADLRVPAALSAGTVACRRAGEQDLPLLVRWHGAYQAEALGRSASRDEVESSMAAGVGARTIWILEHGGVPSCMTLFNATTEDAVQVGGVYTPPELRGRGHGRCAVAGSLLDARREGATRSILFTDEGNLPARRCYAALGYREVGEYALVLFAEPAELG